MPFSLRRKHRKRHDDPNLSLQSLSSSVQSSTQSLNTNKNNNNVNNVNNNKSNSKKRPSSGYLETPAIKSVRSLSRSRSQLSHAEDRDITTTTTTTDDARTVTTALDNASGVSQQPMVEEPPSSVQIEQHMATPESTATTPHNSGIGFINTLVNAAHNAASSLVSAQKPQHEAIKSHPPHNEPANGSTLSTGDRNNSFLQHLDSLLNTPGSTKPTTENKQATASASATAPADQSLATHNEHGELNGQNELRLNDDLESVQSEPRPMTADVVFQPLRNKPIATIGKGQLTLQDLGFNDRPVSPGMGRSLSGRTRSSTTTSFAKIGGGVPDIEITGASPIDGPNTIGAGGAGVGGVVAPMTKGDMSPRLTFESTSTPSRTLVFPQSITHSIDDKGIPAENINDSAISRIRSTDATSISSTARNARSVSPRKRSASPSHFIKSPTARRANNNNNIASASASAASASAEARPSLSTTTFNDTTQSLQSEPSIEGVHFPSVKRQSDFHALFPSIPHGEALLDDYSCALQKDILIQGKMYLSQRHISFNSNILGWTTNLSIPLKEVVQIEKKSVAGLFPNAITVRSLHQRYVFASLMQRDTTFTMILSVWREVVRSERGDGPDTESASLKREQSYDSFDDDDDVTSGEMGSDATDLSDYGSEDETGGDEDEDEEDAGEGVEVEDDDDVDDDMDVNKPDDFEPGAKDAKDTKDAANGGSDGYPGPLKHKPTEFQHDSAPGETKILERTIDAPIGKVFQLIFSNNTSFLKKTIVKQKNHDLSDISPFAKNSENHDSRTYSYVKPLNSPVGPKETLCQVEEIIHQSDFSQYVKAQQRVKSPDVPSGNAFIVNTLFYLTWDVKNSTKITVYTNVEWTGKSWIKGAVEKGTISGQKDSLNNLVDEIIDYISSDSIPSSVDVSEESTSSLPIIGPKTHAPTSAPINQKSTETQVLDDSIPAPLGTTYLLLFSDTDTSVFQNILTRQKNYNIGTIPAFTNKKRYYEYTKPINAPLGPKETRCLVTETIESLDLNKYILVKQSTQSPDVPSGNTFVTVTYIYLSWGESNTTHITVLTEVQWSGRSWIKGPVEKGAVEGQKESMGVLLAELKDVIAKSTTTGGKRKKSAKRGRSETVSGVAAKKSHAVEEKKKEHGGVWDTVMSVLDPALSIVGIDASGMTVWNFLSVLIVGWFALSVIWRGLFGASSSSKSSSVIFSTEGNGIDDISNLIINGEQFLLVPKLDKLLSNDGRKKEAEYEIWDWITKRAGGGIQKDGKGLNHETHPHHQQAADTHDEYARSHSEQNLKFMVDLAEQHIEEIKRSMDLRVNPKERD
jgi:hypothetical protein